MRKTATAHAEAMGRRAGEALRDTGEPTPNPFVRGRVPPVRELARAWARGYVAQLNARRR